MSVTDTLDGDFTWTLDPSDGWALVGNQLTYTDAELAPGASSSAHVSAPTTAEDCRVVPNTATVTTTNDGGDSDSADDRDPVPGRDRHQDGRRVPGDRR